MSAEHVASPRIFKVSYRGPRRVATAYVKVPYSGLYGLTETLTRAMTTGQVLWFRIDVAKKGEITPDVRANLVRWMEGLMSTSETTTVEWSK
jgi:hypothetical protein